MSTTLLAVREEHDQPKLLAEELLNSTNPVRRLNSSVSCLDLGKHNLSLERRCQIKQK